MNSTRFLIQSFCFLLLCITIVIGMLEHAIMASEPLSLALLPVTLMELLVYCLAAFFLTGSSSKSTPVLIIFIMGMLLYSLSHGLVVLYFQSSGSGRLSLLLPFLVAYLFVLGLKRIGLIAWLSRVYTSTFKNEPQKHIDINL